MDMLEIWNQVLENLEGNVSPVGFNIHIKTAVPVCFENSTFTISVATSINKNLVEYRYKKYIESSLEKVTGAKISLAVLVGDANELKQEIESKQNSEYDNSEIISSDGLNSKYTFENFVQGSSNLYAYTAAEQVANHPGESNNPLFIYGNSGLGKTHLMQAIGNKIKANNPNAKIIYVSSENFMNEFITSIREKTGDKFRNKYRAADALLVDDVQFLKNKEATQDEFFHTFNELYLAKKQIVISSDKPPKDMETLEERIRSRFECGLTADIGSPDYETRMAILRRKEEMDNFHLDDEILKYIATNIKSNIRELEGALNKLLAYSNLEQTEITMEVAMKELQNIISPDKPREITPQLIIDVVCEHFHITKEQMISKSRSNDIAKPRQIAMYLCKNMTGVSLENIGELLGGRDHSTVIHGINKVEAELQTNEATVNLLNTIKKKINPN